PMVPSEIGATHGSRIRKRKIDLPQNSLVRQVARILPSTSTRACETSVKMNVLPSDFRNVGLSSALSTLARPTKPDVLLAIFASLRASQSERKNGKPTRAMT